MSLQKPIARSFLLPATLDVNTCISFVAACFIQVYKTCSTFAVQAQLVAHFGTEPVIIDQNGDWQFEDLFAWISKQAHTDDL